MARENQNVRMENMRKAREVWRLKTDGVSLEKISNQLTITTNVIHDILKYTVADHYTPLIKKPSYYDEQLLIKKKLIIEGEKIQTITNSIENKKKIFYIILQATAVIVVALIVL